MVLKLAIALVASAAADSPLDGCQHVFIDAGANIGAAPRDRPTFSRHDFANGRSAPRPRRRRVDATPSTDDPRRGCGVVDGRSAPRPPPRRRESRDAPEATRAGIHTQFLFEPKRFPKSPYRSIYDRYFGADRDPSTTCAVGFEPNPAREAHHAKQASLYAARGWRYLPIMAALGPGPGGKHVGRVDAPCGPTTPRLGRGIRWRRAAATLRLSPRRPARTIQVCSRGVRRCP